MDWVTCADQGLRERRDGCLAYIGFFCDSNVCKYMHVFVSDFILNKEDIWPENHNGERNQSSSTIWPNLTQVVTCLFYWIALIVR